MALHRSTFSYLQPTADQLDAMGLCRSACANCADVLVQHIPDGADKDHALRLLREVSVWANIAITRNPDGSPRDGK